MKYRVVKYSNGMYGIQFKAIVWINYLTFKTFKEAVDSLDSISLEVIETY